MSTSKENKINQVNADGNCEGYWEQYWSNGQLHYRCKGNFINGKFDGLWKEYDENGNLSEKIFFVNI